MRAVARPSAHTHPPAHQRPMHSISAQQDMTGGAHGGGRKRSRRASGQLYALRRNDACAGISRPLAPDL